MRLAIMAAALLSAATVAASAQDLTVNQCLTIHRGLTALDRVGAVLDDTRPPATDAKQYKLGALRMTIASNMATLAGVKDNLERARQQMVREIGGGKPIEPNTPEMDKLLLELQAALDKPCGVTPGRIKLSDLRLGDGPDENPIPPSVLAALDRIIDR